RLMVASPGCTRLPRHAGGQRVGGCADSRIVYARLLMLPAGWFSGEMVDRPPNAGRLCPKKEGFHGQGLGDRQ
ncbi:hypothetical protein MUP01_02710, partial [Candidatus Bathyarchaeota archaeon]|nr:hypothetical protein [Candidatus Bathyarchaeota archaeon]